MKYIVTVTDEKGQIIASSEQPAPRRYLVAEARDVGQVAWDILTSIDKPTTKKDVEGGGT